MPSRLFIWVDWPDRDSKQPTCDLLTDIYSDVHFGWQMAKTILTETLDLHQLHAISNVETRNDRTNRLNHNEIWLWIAVNPQRGDFRRKPSTICNNKYITPWVRAGFSSPIWLFQHGSNIASLRRSRRLTIPRRHDGDLNYQAMLDLLEYNNVNPVTAISQRVRRYIFHWNLSLIFFYEMKMTSRFSPHTYEWIMSEQSNPTRAASYSFPYCVHLDARVTKFRSASSQWCILFTRLTEWFPTKCTVGYHAFIDEILAHRRKEAFCACTR